MSIMVQTIALWVSRSNSERTKYSGKPDLQADLAPVALRDEKQMEIF